MRRPAQNTIAQLQQLATLRQRAELPAAIAHAFLYNMHTTDEQSTLITNETLDDEASYSDDTLEAIADVFEKTFIWYTDQKDRSAFE